MIKLQTQDRIIGLLLAMTAFIVYVVTLSDGAFPGVSAMLLVTHTGLQPALTPAAPLYRFFAGALTLISGDHVVRVLNLFSAFCGAVSVWLLYILMRQGVYFYTEAYQLTESRRRLAAQAAGVTAALFLSYCIPFWSVSNRAHFATFDSLLLLLIACCFVGYASGKASWVALMLAFFYGAGLAQTETLIVFAPLLGSAMLYVMWRRETLRSWLPVGMALLFMAGFMVYLLAAMLFYESPGYIIRGYRGFSQILWYAWRDQFYLITRGLPREGWLIILFVTVAPWMAMFVTARRALNDDQDWGVYILHAIMTALVLAVILNAPLSPWAMQGWRRLLITPYILSAMVFGYLVAFWLLLLKSRMDDSVWRDWLRRSAAAIVLVGLLGALGWSSVQNAKEASARGAWVVDALADKVIQGLDGQSWLLTDGRMDSHLLMAAQRADVPLNVINLQAGGRSLYLQYVATLFEDPRLQNLASLSLPALLREWLPPSAGFYPDIAVFAFSDLWQRYGLTAVPRQFVVLGMQAPTANHVLPMVQDNLAFFESLLAWSEHASKSGGMAEGWVSWALEQASLQANNTGVLLEDVGQDIEAFKAYQMARRLVPGNVSALLNMASMVESQRATDADGSVEQAVNRLMEGIDEKHHIWALSRHYGTVRSPDAFAELGWTWAYSGRPDMAISQLERAAELSPEQPAPGVQGMIGDLYLMDDRPLEGEVIYRSLLSENPENVPALQGMMRVAMRRRDFEQAETYRRQSEQHGLDPVQAVFQQALIEMLSGEHDQARERLEFLLQENRDFLRGWALLAEIGLATGDERLVERCLRRLDGIEGARGLHGSVIRGRQALERQDLASAVDFFETALTHQPGRRAFVETLLRLDLALARRDSVRRHVKTLLQQDPGHALALYVRGSLQIADGDLLMAEVSLRESLKRERLPMALNDLAWLLAERGELDKAEGLINEALAMTEKQPAAWDTKGVILLRTGREEEAAEAFARSLALFGHNPTVHLHMAKAKIALGEREEARQIVELITPVRNRLEPRDRDLLNRLRDALR